MSACAPTPLASGDAHLLSPASSRAVAASAYRITGDSSVRPISVRDDGSRMEIIWSRTQPIPAVIAVGDHGLEEVVNGYMRNDIFVIDRVYTELLFRIDNSQAMARRTMMRRR